MGGLVATVGGSGDESSALGSFWTLDAAAGRHGQLQEWLPGKGFLHLSRGRSFPPRGSKSPWAIFSSQSWSTPFARGTPTFLASWRHLLVALDGADGIFLVDTRGGPTDPVVGRRSPLDLPSGVEVTSHTLWRHAHRPLLLLGLSSGDVVGVGLHGRPSLRLPTRSGSPVQCLALTRDGTVLIGDRAGDLTFVHLADDGTARSVGRLARVHHGAPPGSDYRGATGVTGVALLPCGVHAVSVGADGRMAMLTLDPPAVDFVVRVAHRVPDSEPARPVHGVTATEGGDDPLIVTDGDALRVWRHDCGRPVPPPPDEPAVPASVSVAHFLGLDLVDAARVADGGAVSQLLAAGALVDATDEDGCTALHLAAERDDRSSVRRLLAAGASPDSRTVLGATPLHVAASAAVAAALLAAGASVRAVDQHGQTALHAAADAADVTRALLLLIADEGVVDLPDAAGETALHRAARLGCVPLLAVLASVAGSANYGHEEPDEAGGVDAVTAAGATPLHLALTEAPLVDAALSLDATLTSHKSDSSLSSLSPPTSHESLPGVTTRMTSVSSPAPSPHRPPSSTSRLPSTTQFSPPSSSSSLPATLPSAASAGRSGADRVAPLVPAGSLALFEGSVVSAALADGVARGARVAHQRGAADATRILLQLRASPTRAIADGTGRTPMHLAAERGSSLLCSLLFEAGATVRARDGRGRAAVDVARSLGARRFLQSAAVAEGGLDLLVDDETLSEAAATRIARLTAKLDAADDEVRRLRAREALLTASTVDQLRAAIATAGPEAVDIDQLYQTHLAGAAAVHSYRLPPNGSEGS